MLKIANKDGYRYSESAYLIGNEFGLICVSYGYDVQDALDNAVNAGYMDSERMADADHAEYNANNWHDSFIYAGNASEPFWAEYLWIKAADERKK